MSLSPHGRRHCARCRRARCRWGFAVSGFHLQRGVPPTVGAVGGQLRCKWNPAAAAAVGGIPPTAAAVVGIPPTARTHLQSVTTPVRMLLTADLSLVERHHAGHCGHRRLHSTSPTSRDGRHSCLSNTCLGQRTFGVKVGPLSPRKELHGHLLGPRSRGCVTTAYSAPPSRQGL